MSQPRRKWDDANEKRTECRICGDPNVELAHVTRREYDPRIGSVRYVRPDSVVPLCGYHHREYDSHRLDLLPHLTIPEQVMAVSDMGLERARIRICGNRRNRTGEPVVW